MTMDMRHLDQLPGVMDSDLKEITHKEATYQGSWKKRGGIGAWMMIARKLDRLENMMAQHGQDVFQAVEAGGLTGADGTALAEIRDLRRYLALVEAEIMVRARDAEVKDAVAHEKLVMLRSVEPVLARLMPADPVSRKQWLAVTEQIRDLERVVVPDEARGL